MIAQILHFLSRNYLVILIVSIPLLFMIIREIILVTRRKRKTNLIEKNIQEKYNHIETLKDELSQHKNTLLESFKTLNELTSTIANNQTDDQADDQANDQANVKTMNQKKAPKDTDTKQNDNT